MIVVPSSAHDMTEHDCLGSLGSDLPRTSCGKLDADDCLDLVRSGG